MAYDGWVEFNGREFINHARTIALVESLSIERVVWIDEEKVSWIADALGEADYDDIATAPWYDEGYPASAEFAGFVSLGLPGLDDSTLTSSPGEFIGDGGYSGKPRNAILSIVGSVAVVAATERGAEFGKRYLDRILKGSLADGTYCKGATMRYFRWAEETSPKARRIDVRLTRGAAVTRKRNTDCAAVWITSFTLTAADPYQYGEPVEQILALDETPPPSGAQVASYGSQSIVQASCPVYDYTPLYDPLHPALVPTPATPDFYPDGWDLSDGDIFDRYWVRLNPVEPSDLLVVPVITLTSVDEVRMVRVSIWPSASENDDQCDPLFTAVVTYLPAGVEFTIDGVQKACYVWDGFSAAVRRTDSLVFGTDATPINWTAFNDDGGMLVTLDIFDGSETVSLALDFVSKSD